MRILASSMPGWAIPLIIVAVFGIIVVGVILVKKYVHFFQSDEKPKSDKEIAKEVNLIQQNGVKILGAVTIVE